MTQKGFLGENALTLITQSQSTHHSPGRGPPYPSCIQQLILQPAQHFPGTALGICSVVVLASLAMLFLFIGTPGCSFRRCGVLDLGPAENTSFPLGARNLLLQSKLQGEGEKTKGFLVEENTSGCEEAGDIIVSCRL